MSISASERIRQETRGPHDRVEALPFFTDLERGRLSLEGYLSFLRACRTLFRAIEDAAGGSAHPAVQAVFRPEDAATPMLQRDLLAIDTAPNRMFCEAELRAVGVAQDLLFAAEREPLRLVGYLYVLVGSQLGGLVLRDQVARALDHSGPEGLAFVGRGGPQAAARWGAFRGRLDAALTDEASQAEAIAGAQALFTAFAHVLEGLPPYSPATPYFQAKNLNMEAGSHGVTEDPRELEAALRAGEHTWKAFPYYEKRYAQRGRQFTRSDSAWLVTLAHGPQSVVDHQVSWLARVLAARGMPRFLLEQHLVTLHRELTRAVPERAALYDKLLVAAEQLAAVRRVHVSDEQLVELGRRFDEKVGPELAAALPRTGELLAAAVADEQNGIAEAVSSLTGWLTDPSRFPLAWAEAVRAVLASAKAGLQRG